MSRGSTANEGVGFRQYLDYFFAGEYGMVGKRLAYEPSMRAASIPGTFFSTMTWLTRSSTAESSGQNGWSTTPRTGGGEKKPAGWRDAWLYEYLEYPGPLLRH
jgi:hypothetical protein